MSFTHDYEGTTSMFCDALAVFSLTFSLFIVISSVFFLLDTPFFNVCIIPKTNFLYY